MNRDFWRDRRVFLTGHSGFKGSWLSEWFVHTGVAHAGYSLPADVLDAERIRRNLHSYSPDILIHMAAQALVKTGYKEPQATFATNVQGTVNVLDAARDLEIKSILIVTSDKVYADWGEHPHKEGDPLGGNDPYSASKACTEHVAAAYRDSYGLPIATARAGNVIGGWDTAPYRLIPNIMRAKKSGKPLSIPRPDATRPWQHVLDCLSGYISLAQALYFDPAFAAPFNFGPDDLSWTVLDVVKAFDCPYEIIDAEFHEREILALDSSKAKDLLHWRPKLSVAEAIKWTQRAYEGKITMRSQIEEYVAL